MNTRLTTAISYVKQHISPSAILIAMLSILHLRGGFSVCSLMDGAVMLRCHCHALWMRIEGTLAVSTSSFEDSPDSNFFPAMVYGDGCLVSTNLTLLLTTQ